MNPIQMVDLTTQYSHIQLEIDDAILNVVRKGQYINGPEVDEFAKAFSEFTGSRFVIPCANGTDALQISLMSLNLKPGDEVIVPAFTYAAAAEAVALLGLIPVVVDVDPLTCNLDPEKLKTAISSRTRAIIPVHLFGQVADIAAIQNVIKRTSIAIIEDNAQSIGSFYTFPNGQRQQAGTIGKIGILSFFPTKNLACFGDGGAMLTNDEALALVLQQIARHGQSSKYHHRRIGCNSRLDTIQAAVLSVKLKHLAGFIEARQKAAKYYLDHLSKLSDFITLPQLVSFSTHVFNQFTIQVKRGKRDSLQHSLKEKGIPSTVYYPLPLHKQEAFSPIVRAGSDLRFSESLCKTVLSLPMHTELEEDQLEFIVKNIVDFFS